MGVGKWMGEQGERDEKREEKPPSWFHLGGEHTNTQISEFINGFGFPSAFSNTSFYCPNLVWAKFLEKHKCAPHPRQWGLHPNFLFVPNPASLQWFSTRGSSALWRHVEMCGGIFSYLSAWEFSGSGPRMPTMNRSELHSKELWPKTPVLPPLKMLCALGSWKRGVSCSQVCPQGSLARSKISINTWVKEWVNAVLYGPSSQKSSACSKHTPKTRALTHQSETD